MEYRLRSRTATRKTGCEASQLLMVQLAAHVFQLSFQLLLRLSEPAHLAHISGGVSCAWQYESRAHSYRSAYLCALVCGGLYVSKRACELSTGSTDRRVSRPVPRDVLPIAPYFSTIRGLSEVDRLVTRGVRAVGLGAGGPGANLFFYSTSVYPLSLHRASGGRSRCRSGGTHQ